MGIRNRLISGFFPQAIASQTMRRLAAKGGIVLMYHEVLPNACSLPAWTVVRESDFRWQMAYLCTHFDILTMDQAMARLASGRQEKRPFAVITFDDGYRGNVHTVLPVMASMGMPFLVYVATKAIVEGQLYWHDRLINLLCASVTQEVMVRLPDGRQLRFVIPSGRYSENRRWLAMQQLLGFLKTREPGERRKLVVDILEQFPETGSELAMLHPDELRRLAAADGVTIGAHTHGHELLIQLQPEEMLTTLRTANEVIAGLTGYAPRHFAYPNGDLNQQVMQQVQNSGYVTAVTTREGIWSAAGGLYEIPRISVGRFDSKNRFRALVSGWL